MKGIKDLLWQQGYKPSALQKRLLDSGVPGSWSTIQNVYNLINGDVRPKDAYVFIVIADLLDIGLEDVLMRYSEIQVVDTENEIHW